MGDRRYLACLALIVSSCDWLTSDLDNRDGAGITIEREAEQPSSPANGVLLRVSSRGGKSLQLTLEGGTFVAAASCATDDAAKPDAGVQPCGCFAADGQLALSVRPASNEALLTVILRADASCTGAPVASRQVPIKPAAVPAEIDAGADATPAIDARSTDAQ